MNVDRTEAAAAYQWPSDCLTMWCALPTAGGWGLSPDWLSSRITDEQAPPAANLGSLERQHHVPSINVDTTGHFLLRCISEKSSRGHQCWIHIFCGFLFVALQQDLYCTKEDWMDNEWTLHCGTFDKKTTAGRHMANDEWSYCVCSDTPTLFSSRKKIEEQVNGCFTPQRLTPVEAYLLLFWNKFSLFYCFFFT